MEILEVDANDQTPYLQQLHLPGCTRTYKERKPTAYIPGTWYRASQ